MFLHLSVILFTVGGVLLGPGSVPLGPGGGRNFPGHTPGHKHTHSDPPGHTHTWTSLDTHTLDTTNVQQAGGTQPTGMLSCLKKIKSGVPKPVVVVAVELYLRCAIASGFQTFLNKSVTPLLECL